MLDSPLLPSLLKSHQLLHPLAFAPKYSKDRSKVPWRQLLSSVSDSAWAGGWSAATQPAASEAQVPNDQCSLQALRMGRGEVGTHRAVRD